MKNRIFNFVLDLFKNGDEEEQAGIFAQVKIYARDTSAFSVKLIKTPPILAKKEASLISLQRLFIPR